MDAEDLKAFLTKREEKGQVDFVAFCRTFIKSIKSDRDSSAGCFNAVVNSLVDFLAVKTSMWLR
ncbi:hypothetical protein DDR33_05550 [Pararcticibacter amylolyticus]|uniref:Uncharacterized protein n=1 Tax=Pararcticibacter amylolyticus TaxID=2173175 RepID=A0A2U2PKM4_9SPHI|nr:hypothetical protein DDR33_05550 [Pararcticibacter amylolyticus]